MDAASGKRGHANTTKRVYVDYPVRPAQPVIEAALPRDVKLVADWVTRNDKHDGRPFIIADKAHGLIFAFRETGELIAKGRALYGAMRTDEMTQEQADKTWEQLVAADKITPAGIFPALGYQSPAYGASIRFAELANSNLLIHRAPAEWRRKNLQSAQAERMRVTYGCINVLPEFLDNVLMPIFNGESTVVILPETQSAREFFAIDDSSPATLQTAHR
ncbi:MAG: hypothetical protein JWN94_4667 [Betaproteobacteria bacterium]|nr:hypothetical protein [Betaproteobacteria bacterium]